MRTRTVSRARVSDQDRGTGCRLQILEHLLHTGEQAGDPDIEDMVDVLGTGREDILHATAPERRPENGADGSQAFPNLGNGSPNRRGITRVRLKGGGIEAVGLQARYPFSEPLSVPAHQREGVPLPPESRGRRLRYSRTITEDNQCTHA